LPRGARRIASFRPDPPTFRNRDGRNFACHCQWESVHREPTQTPQHSPRPAASTDARDNRRDRCQNGHTSTDCGSSDCRSRARRRPPLARPFHQTASRPSAPRARRKSPATPCHRAVAPGTRRAGVPSSMVSVTALSMPVGQNGQSWSADHGQPAVMANCSRSWTRHVSHSVIALPMSSTLRLRKAESRRSAT